MKKIIILATLAMLTAGQAMAQQAPTNSQSQSSGPSQADQMHEGNGSSNS